MKVLVNEMPKKKEECLFYKLSFYNEPYCRLTDNKCSFKNEGSVLGGKCRCLKVFS